MLPFLCVALAVLAVALAVEVHGLRADNDHLARELRVQRREYAVLYARAARHEPPAGSP